MFQPVGFVVLIAGIWLYNDVILRPLFLKITGRSKPKAASSSQEAAEKPEEAEEKFANESAGDKQMNVAKG